MRIIEEGEGELLAWHDPDEQRKWILENKSRAMTDKRMSMTEAVSRFAKDGDYLAMGGFGHIRISMAAIYEMIRQGRKNMAIGAKTAVHDFDVLVAAGCVDRIEVAYSFGHEIRGLSPASRRTVQEGRAKVVAEISNAGFQWRFKAAAMGLPYMPSRVMMGTDTLRKSSAKVVEDPFSGKPLCLLPACYPDIVFIHVNRCDKYGNCQIDGIIIEDFELARAARRLVITTEEIVDDDVIRDEPWKTVIPFYLVDAVVEVPGGSHPGNMPYHYYSDEEHMAEWLDMSKTPEGTREYFEKYVFGTTDFDEYLELVGGAEKMRYLKELEFRKAPLTTPWKKGGK